MESDTGGTTLCLVVDLKSEADLPEGASCAAILAMAARAVSNLDVLGRAASRQNGRESSRVCCEIGRHTTETGTVFSHVTSEAVSLVGLISPRVGPVPVE